MFFGFGGTLAAGSGLVKTATVLSLHLGSFLPPDVNRVLVSLVLFGFLIHQRGTDRDPE